MSTVFSGRDFNVKSIMGVQHVELNPTFPEEQTHPFFVSVTTEGEDLKYNVVPGTYMSIEPTDLIGDIGEGEQYLYIKVSYTLNPINGYVASSTLDTVEIVVEDSLISEPQGPNDTGVYYILLAGIYEGEKFAQYITSSLQGHPTDNGTADDRALLIVGSTLSL